MLLIIDGNNLAHRARHVFSLSNNGKSVSVTYGFLHTLQSYLVKFKPESVMVCWDGGTPNYRRIAVPEYKANRTHAEEDDYIDFMRQVHELCDYAFPMMGVVSVRRIGAEADDIMYHASRIMKGDSIIITSDKDLLQAIDAHTSVYNPARDKVYTRELFETDFGIPLSDYLDWKALIGDSSDNVPGVPGIGEKTATKLLREFGSLTALVNYALGHGVNKELVMSEKIRASILSFGFERIVKNIYIMALYVDRTGSRQAIVDALENYMPVDKKRVKMYLMKNAFISMMEELPVLLSRLCEPKIKDRDTIRIPVVCDTRSPIV